MVPSTYLRFVVSTVVLCLAVTPALVFSDGSDSSTNNGSQNTGTPTNGGVSSDGTPPSQPELPPMGPGGGAGGTIGSLPSIITPGATGTGGGFMLSTSGAPNPPIVTISPLFKSGVPVAFGWIANGNTVFGGYVSPSAPSLSFYSTDLKTAQGSFKSLVLIFMGTGGAVTSAVDIQKLPL